MVVEVKLLRYKGVVDVWMGFLSDSAVKNPSAMQEAQVRPLGQEDPWSSA